MSTISLNDFKKNLEAGKYNSIAGARRGVGKIQGWSDDIRTQAGKLVDKHFGAEASAKKPAKAASGTGKKRGRPPGSKNKTQAPKAAKPVKAAKAVKATKPKAAPKREVKASAPKAATVRRRPTKDASTGSIQNLADVVGTVSEALSAIKACRDSSPAHAEELDAEALAAGKILGAVVKELGNRVLPTQATSPVAGAPQGKKRGRKPAVAAAVDAAPSESATPLESPPESVQEPAAVAS